MGITTTVLSCIMLSASAYNVPSDVLLAIHKVEGGYNGAVIENTNGTVDMGAMQINSLWIETLSKEWDLPWSEVKERLISDSCTSASVAGWILSENLKDTGGDMQKSIGWYHSRTPKYRDKYIKKVLAQLAIINKNKDNN